MYMKMNSSFFEIQVFPHVSETMNGGLYETNE